MPDEAIRVIVRWLTRAEGGRVRPFVGARYAPTVSLASSADEQAWSAVIDFDDAKAPIAGRLHLLSADAPRDWPTAGKPLLVHEGRRMVALCFRDTICGA